jgi:hypothetical protein
MIKQEKAETPCKQAAPTRALLGLDKSIKLEPSTPTSTPAKRPREDEEPSYVFLSSDSESEEASPHRVKRSRREG